MAYRSSDEFESATVFSMTAIIVTLFVIIAIMIIGYFAWYVPVYQQPTIIERTVETPTYTPVPVPGPPGPQGPPGPPGQSGPPGEPPPPGG